MTVAEVARVSTLVAVDPAEAFRVFTEEIDLWWRRGPRHRPGTGTNGALDFEHDAGVRRLVESYADGDRFVIGDVLAWQPGERLVFEWREPSFEAHERTEVEVRFERAGDGTRVSLEHRGWETVALASAARHGLSGPALEAMIGYRFGDLLLDLRHWLRRHGLKRHPGAAAE